MLKEFAEIIEKKLKEYYNTDKIYIHIQMITTDKLLIQLEFNNDLVEFDFDYDIGLNVDENIFILKYEIDGNIANYYKK